MSTSNAVTFHVVKVTSPAAALALNEAFGDWGAGDDWEAEPSDVADGEEAAERFAYDISSSDFDAQIGRLAKEHGLQIAVHADWSQEIEQGSVAGDVTWYDGVTGKQGYYKAEVNGFRPVFSVEDLLAIMAAGAKTVPEAMAASNDAAPDWVHALFADDAE